MLHGEGMLQCPQLGSLLRLGTDAKKMQGDGDSQRVSRVAFIRRIQEEAGHLPRMAQEWLVLHLRGPFQLHRCTGHFSTGRVSALP